MFETIKKDWTAQVLVGLFILLSAWWLFLRLTTDSAHLNNQLFAAMYGIIALWGGLWGLQSAHNWGWNKSIMGRSILMFSLGLLAQEFGQLAYSYYIYFAKIEVPYPSWGDLGYFGSIPLYIYGIWLLAKASGVKIGLKSFENKLQAIIIPLVLLGAGYYLFLQGYEFDWSNPLTIFLDFGYPLAQAIYVSLAILTYLLSRNVLGGIMRPKILFILFALIVQFIADYTFLYQASQDAWYAGGVNDYIYLTSYTLMALGLFQLKITVMQLKNSKPSNIK